MAESSLVFLTIPACVAGIDSATRLEYVQKGYYSFYDYSVACWALHLRESLIKSTTDEAKNQLAECLGAFIETHWSNNATTIMVPPAVEEELGIFKGEDFFSKLCQAVVSTRKQLSRHGQ